MKTHFHWREIPHCIRSSNDHASFLIFISSVCFMYLREMQRGRRGGGNIPGTVIRSTKLKDYGRYVLTPA
jgi:hypothetical protein